jgi:hypothetical protein
MIHCRPLSIAVFLACLTMPSVATTEETGASRPRRVVEQSLGASYNSLGVQHVLGVRWTRPLSASQRPLLADAHVSAGLSHTLTPSYTRLGAWAEVAPLSILELRAGVEPGLYFGSFGSLMSFSGYDSDFGDRARDARPGEARAGTGGRLYLSPCVKVKLGSIALASTVTIEWWSSSVAGPYFYEPSRDTLLRAAGDRLLTASSVLVRQVPQGRGGRLTYGVGYELTDVLDAPGNLSQKLGLVVAHRFATRHLGLPSPSLGARVAYYLDDPSRKGQLTAALGISVER